MKTKSIVLILLLGACSVLLSQVPRNMNYQGKLTDIAGVGMNGDYDMTFRIYDVETGGVALWEEVHDGADSVTVVKGLFDVKLGTAIPIDIPFDVPYWMEIEIEGDVLIPRVRLATVPYAFRTAYADSAGIGVVVTDGVTIEGDGTVGDELGVMDGGITEVQLNASVAGNGLAGGAGVPLTALVDSMTIEIGGDGAIRQGNGAAAAISANRKLFRNY